MRIGGWVRVVIDGRQMVLSGEVADLQPGGITREVVSDAAGAMAGYLEKQQHATFRLTFVHRSDGPTIREVQGWAGVPASVELANGRRYTTDSLYTASVTSINAAAGTFEAEVFAGGPLEEIA